MKLQDIRCGRTFEGELVEHLPANQETSDEALLKYYRCAPTDKHYEILKKADPKVRLVLKRPAEHGVDAGYYILPLHAFYVEV